MQNETQLRRAGSPLRVRLIRIAATLLLAVVVSAYLDRETHVLDLVEQRSYGGRIEVAARVDDAAERRARNRIVLVTLSDSSFAPRSGLAPQPFLARADHAGIIRRLTRCGAKVVAFDFLFDTPQPGDGALASAVQGSGRVLLAAGDDSSEPPSLMLPEARLLRAGAHWGHTRCPINADRPALDRVPPVVVERDRRVPAFCLEAVRMALGCSKPLVRTHDGWRCGTMQIPVNEDGTFMLRYSGDQAGFAMIPYEDVLTSTPAETPFYRSIFHDKIVLIGDTTRIHGDTHLTPLGMMSGVEIQAHAIATLLAGRFVRDAPWAANLGAIVVLALLAALLALLCRTPWIMPLLALLLFAYAWFDVWLFVERDTALHLIAPTLAVLAMTAGILSEQILNALHEKARVREILVRYVSRKIADHLLKNQHLIGHAGKRATGTVLFCDVRRFTAHSERLPPEELVSRMNAYFDVMTHILFQHDATVVSIVGDALLAVFGIPVPFGDHARRAVAAAFEMEGALGGIRERWREEGQDVFDIGIGINTGEMVVGDIGGRHLMNFTVYGLQVNIAQRIEDLNKELGSRILITRATYELVKDEIRTCPPVRKSLDGMEGAVEVYEVTGWREKELRATQELQAKPTGSSPFG